MARGAEAKLRRRNRKKADDAAVTDMFGTDDTAGDDSIPLPPAASVNKNSAIIEDASSDDENLPKKKKKSSKSKSLPEGAAAPAGKGGVGGSGIKTTPLILLIMMVGTTLLPALIYAGDYASSFLAKNNVAGAIGFRLGIGAVPKKRVLSFYEKHAPEKLGDVPTILSKHYGDYPQLIKKLERKYQDYGYFVGWQEDEAPMRIAMEHLQATYDTWLQQYWNRYAPQILKTAFRNMRYNLTFLYKKGSKLWKKHVWPLIEPVFGVPDGAAAQKRKDAAEARKRRDAAGKKTGRRKNADFRDDVED
jgi:hypothetical protein